MKEVKIIRCSHCESMEKSDRVCTLSQYECEICHEIYRDKEEAVACEAQGTLGGVYPVGTKMAVLTDKHWFEKVPYPSPQYKDQVYAIGIVEKHFSIDKHGKSGQYPITFRNNKGEEVGYQTVRDSEAEAAVLLARFFAAHDVQRLTKEDVLLEK